MKKDKFFLRNGWGNCCVVISQKRTSWENVRALSPWITSRGQCNENVKWIRSNLHSRSIDLRRIELRIFSSFHWILNPIFSHSWFISWQINLILWKNEWWWHQWGACDWDKEVQGRRCFFWCLATSMLTKYTIFQLLLFLKQKQEQHFYLNIFVFDKNSTYDFFSMTCVRGIRTSMYFWVYKYIRRMWDWTGNFPSICKVFYHSEST